MLDKDNTLEYNYKILSQERKKKKISQENASIQITLSVSQIKSLENNLDSGFINDHFKILSLKRYAKFLEIDFNKIIPPKDTHLDEYIAEEQIVGEVEDDLPLDTPPKLNKVKISKIGTLIGLTILGLILTIFFTQSNKDKTPDPEIVIGDVNIAKEALMDNDVSAPVNKDFIQNEKVATVSKENAQEIENKSNIIPIEFLCSIKSASMDKIWSRANPEKPATYFHIISQEKQSICTIDNRGIFKQYDLGEGGKITHRGEAPFKVQLNPAISELYFQGWKVILNENENFIQLNPVKINTEINY
jgi:cytoskeletal protein RodZ